ncbi:(5-formylfuran-3-yl)methyl phosphate synthase [Candidatus Bathyarchaeota archaeon]|nr:(5-formylfuran-3-yl)methyl phosphate synthase [Candidatus Bathyarchaeota archaeon]
MKSKIFLDVSRFLDDPNGPLKAVVMRGKWMKLLVSVRDLDEAFNALRGGAQIIDVKNPEEGSLGAHHPTVIRKISEVVSGKAEISATLGDLPNLPGTASLAALGAAVSGARYVKVGLFGVKTRSEAEVMLRAVCMAVRDYDVKVIAAGYADYSNFGCVNPLELPMAAYQAGADGVMIDVKRKSPSRKLFEYFGDAELQKYVEEAHRINLMVALAGSLDIGDAGRVYSLGADIMGIRRGACRDDSRTGRKIDEGIVAKYVEEINKLTRRNLHCKHDL